VPRHSFLSGILGNSASRYTFHNARTGGLLASHVELAVDSASGAAGFSAAIRSDEGSALIIAPCNSIHTFFMRFDIDVVFVARDGRVLKTAPRFQGGESRSALSVCCRRVARGHARKGRDEGWRYRRAVTFGRIGVAPLSWRGRDEEDMYQRLARTRQSQTLPANITAVPNVSIT
jgi:hypothetical protein